MVEAPCTAICTSNKQLPLNSSGRKLFDYHEESAVTFLYVWKAD